LAIIFAGIMKDMSFIERIKKEKFDMMIHEFYYDHKLLATILEIPTTILINITPCDGVISYISGLKS